MSANMKQVNGWWCTTHNTWSYEHSWCCANRTTYFDDDPSKPSYHGTIRNRLPCKLTELYINTEAPVVEPTDPERHIERIEASLAEHPYPYTREQREADLASEREADAGD